MSATSGQIKPETLAIIEKQAKNFGLSADEYLRNLLPETEDDLALKAEADDDEFEADMIAFAETTDDLQIYHCTSSREDIYFDHD